MSLLNKHDYLVIVVSNQAGVARGYYGEDDVRRLHRYINEELEQYGAHIDAFYYCPHHPEAGIGKYRIRCHCRKPETGMLEQACGDFPIDVAASWMIGDNCGDILAGNRFGLKTILVETGYGQKLIEEGFDSNDYTAGDLFIAVNMILKMDQDSRL